MAYTEINKKWYLQVPHGATVEYGVLTYFYGNDAYTLVRTDSNYNAIVSSEVAGSSPALLAEARKVIATEVYLTGASTESDIVDRIGYLNDTVSIDFINAGAAVVWNIGELVEPEHFQAIKELIIKYLNDLTNVK